MNETAGPGTWAIYRRTIGLLAGERRLAIALMLAGAGVAVVQLAEPVLFGRMIDSLAAGTGAFGLIGLWALAMSAGLKLSKVTGMIAPYPTRGEISKRAAGAYFSPKIFDNPLLKKVVRLVQVLLP